MRPHPSSYEHDKDIRNIFFIWIWIRQGYIKIKILSVQKLT
jgi:hypothetical protein